MKNVFFIGPGKSGTSFIYNVLSESGVYCGSNKESNYYITQADRAKQNYKREYGDERIIDFSNTYFYSPQVSQSIIRDFPDSVFVVVRRDPTERLASHIRYLKARGETRGTCTEILKNNRDLYLTYYFDFFLNLWTKSIGREKVKVIDFSNLRSFEKLKTDLMELNIIIHNEAFSSSDSYSTPLTQGTRLTKSVILCGRFLKSIVGVKAFGKFKQSHIVKGIVKYSGTKANQSKAEIEADIREFYSGYDKK